MRGEKGGASVWAITPEERGKHDKQFDSLAPVLGYVSGEQARKFFLQSGLPAPVLAEIWNLADMESDGKMDRQEFSIAMKLIKLKLQGRNLPSVLPITMKQTPVCNAAPTIRSSAGFGMGSMPNLSIGLSSMSAMPRLTPIPANPSMHSLLPTPMTLPLINCLGNCGLPNGNINLLSPPLVPNNAALPLSGFSSPMAFSPSTGMSKANSLLDLGSSSSNSSSTTSLASNSPKTGASDWGVPQGARLKYRQQFNTLDKLMSGYLSGPQVRNALIASNLTQTQLATIWTLADVDKDGQLQADEFILAMHLVEMAKTGRPLPLTLPQDLVPPSVRGGFQPIELVNGTGPHITPCLIDTLEILPSQKNINNVSYEDRLKENFARGSAELEKRRLALEEEQRKERERRDREEREAHERREREAREQENRRRLEEERRREMERQREEERLRELERMEAAKQEMELRAKKKGLELELEAVGNKHKQISDCLRDAKSKRRILKAEVDLVNQKRDARIIEINTLQLQFEDWQKKLSILIPEQQRLTEKLRSLNLNKISSVTLTSVSGSANEKGVKCRRLKDQLDTLERETTDKLAEMEQYNKELKLGDMDDCVLRGLLSLLACLSQLFLLIKELREKQVRQQAVLDDLHRVKEEKKSKQPVLVAQPSSKLTPYRALYSFVARNTDELSIDADGTIEVDEQTVGEPGWLCGRFNGKRGWFPQSYAEKCHTPSTSTTETPASLPGKMSCPPPIPHNTGDLDGKVADDSTVSAQADTSQSFFPLLARAVSSWSATSETHLNLSSGAGDVITPMLSFSQGDIISVQQQREDWWLGQLNGTQGWFPKSYVTLEMGGNTDVDPFDTCDSVQLEGNKSWSFDQKACCICLANRDRPGRQLIVVLAKNSTGWWLGELQARGKKRQRGWFHSSHVKLLGPSSSKSSPSPLPVCQVIAMYDYTAANRDELSFSKGQLISVLDKTNPDWWKGDVNGVTGLLPTNYVQMTTESDPSQQCTVDPPSMSEHGETDGCADLMSLDTMTPQERKRQGYIHELIQTEETYVEDLELVLEVFYKPMSESGRLTEAEMGIIFVNWRELIMSNTKLLKALRVRKKTEGDNMPVQLIGDLLASELAHMQAYISFCSCQLNAAALLQSKTQDQQDFKDFLKKIATNYRCKGMPLSSFLLKPMQRITRYPLLIKNILEHTPDNHADHGPLREALEGAEELCSQVNEGVREKENSDRLEWIQSHVQSEGTIEHLVFNSLTNCLGPRKLLHSGRLYKTKSSRELWAFLFNDFFLLTQSAKPFSSSGPDRLFSLKTNIQLKMYKTPLFLNEVLVKMPADPSSDEPLFHVSHIDRVYTLKTETLNERTTWVQKIKAASEHFIETEKKKREKAYQARSLKSSGIGRLLVTVAEAQELKACKPNGKSNPYCELTMGAQCYTSRPASDTLNPKWNFNCQFFIKDLYQDILCITVFEKDQFSPDDFLGRTEVPVATIKKEMESKGAANRRLLLHEVPTGEVWVKLDLQLYEPTK
ncbi:hypothetical protein JOQ06_004399 [Pogonophryne albipinna]|uniref:Intersectin-2-like n=1 Tax=Pogonophryne albipinna TaxID=1090488 RepID=A0AAD6ANE6_9TELE|nr:hypothetical protein JOQ06_004399 [Pogonophryne albipinna]